MISFFIPMSDVPTTTHQEKSVRVVKGKPQFYEPSKLKAARATFTMSLKRNRPDTPLRGAVRLLVRWQFPHGKSHKDGEWKSTRPDTDNLQKLLKDCMTDAGFWKNDAQVASETCEKIWSATPGLYICAEEINPSETVRGANRCFDCPAWNEDSGCLAPFTVAGGCPLA